MQKNINTINDYPIPKAEKFKNEFDYESSCLMYYNIMYELYSTTFKWLRLPDYMYEEGADVYCENYLTLGGKVLFFEDKDLDRFFLYKYTGYGINFYGFPRAFQVSNPIGYSKKIERGNAVEIFNSPYRTPENTTIRNFAEKLATCDMILMLNLHSQKMPYLISTTQESGLSSKNFMNKLNTYEPNIFVDKDFDLDAIKVFQTKSDFIAPQVYALKNNIWQEFLRMAGIAGINGKAERVNVLEEQDSQAESNSFLTTRLATRKNACKLINERWGLDVDVEVRDDLKIRLDMLDLDNYLKIFGNLDEEQDKEPEEKEKKEVEE